MELLQYTSIVYFNTTIRFFRLRFYCWLPASTTFLAPFTAFQAHIVRAGVHPWVRAARRWWLLVSLWPTRAIILMRHCRGHSRGHILSFNTCKMIVIPWHCIYVVVHRRCEWWRCGFSLYRGFISVLSLTTLRYHSDSRRLQLHYRYDTKLRQELVLPGRCDFL